MRQSMLAFGQRPLNPPQLVQTPTQEERSSEEVKTSKVHPFFATTKRVRKEADNYNDGKENLITQKEITHSPPPTKKRLTSDFNKVHQSSKYKEAPWPGKGESSIQPEEDLSQYHSNNSHPLSAFRKKDTGKAKEGLHEEASESSWSWLYAPSKVAQLNGKREEKRNVIANTQFIESEVDLKACENAEGELLYAIRQAKLAALTDSTQKSSVLWTDRWRPSQANEVLGNEKQAMYLRDWLQTVKVVDRNLSNGTSFSNPNIDVLPQKPSSRPIIKRAQKKRGRVAAPKEMDDFIVGDTPEEEAWFDQFRKKEIVLPESSQNSENQSSTITISEHEDDLDFSKSTQLTNLIILEGPSGCGKTASVYACAKELGFDVFEVFPGMGKRSGLHVTTMVGDLCSNHMVSSGSKGSGGGGVFQKKIVGTSVPAHGHPSSKSTNQTGQSLILFEEVDLMYEDDKGFWQGLIALAGDSLRPLILTCNDISAIPLNDLPVQKVLHFSAPSPTIAVPYLQLVALAEGKQVDTITIRSKYLGLDRVEEQMRHDEDLILNKDGPLIIASDYNPKNGKCDLRQTMLQVQFDSEGSCMNKLQSIETPTGRLRSCIAAAELQSFADCIFARSHESGTADLDFEQFSPSPDDVTTLYRPLFLTPGKGSEICLPAFRREQEYLGFIFGERASLRGGSHLLPLDYHHIRAQMSKNIQDILDRLNITPQSRAPSRESVLDYAPFIQKMVFEDDEEDRQIHANVTEMLAEGSQGEDGILMTRGYSRQKLNMIRKGDEIGLLNLLYREANFSRWLPLTDQMVDHARSFSPSVQW